MVTNDKASANRFRFRAWNKKTKLMTYGIEEMCCDYDRTSLMHFLNDEDEEVLQSTGLKDKNGNEIFEGDMVNVGNVNWNIRWYAASAAFWLFSIAPINESNRIASSGSPARDWNWLDGGVQVYWHKVKESNDVEVIGNIYENPDLLPSS